MPKADAENTTRTPEPRPADRRPSTAPQAEALSPSRRDLGAAVAAFLMVRGTPAVAATPVPIDVPPPASTPEPHPDAPLLQLDDRLSKAWAKENTAWADAEDEDDDDGPKGLVAVQLNEATRRLVEIIGNTHASTLDGLLVKMRAIAWCRSGRPFDLSDLHHRAGEAPTDMKLLADLLGDLSRMGRTV